MAMLNRISQIKDPLARMNRVQKLGLAVAALYLVLLPWLLLVLMSARTRPKPSEGVVIISHEAAPSPLPMIGLEGWALLTLLATAAYVGYVLHLKHRQRENSRLHAQSYDTYRLTFGTDGRCTHLQMSVALEAVYGVLRRSERERLEGAAPSVEFCVIANKDAGKSMYLRVPRGNISLVSSLRAELGNLHGSFQMTWVEQLPLKLAAPVQKQGLRVVWQGAKLAKQSAYPLASAFPKGDSPIASLVQMLSVDGQRPMAGVVIQVRAGGTLWLSQSAGEINRLKKGQAGAKAGMRDTQTAALIKALEDKRQRAQKGCFQLGRVIAFAASYDATAAKGMVDAMHNTWLIAKTRHHNEFVPTSSAVEGDLAAFEAWLSEGTVWGLSEHSNITAEELAGLVWPPRNDVVPDWAQSGSRYLPPDQAMTEGEEDEPIPAGRAPIHAPKLRRRPIIGKANWRNQGVVIGYNNRQNGLYIRVKMMMIDLIRHIYVLGITGSGKTTFLINLLLSCIAERMSAIYIEPHGDGRKFIERIPDELEDEVVLIDPERQIGENRSVTMNILATRADKSDVERVKSQVMSVFAKLIDYGQAPRSKIVVETSLDILLRTEDQPTLHEFWRFLDDKDYRAELIAKAPPGYSANWQAGIAELDDKKLEEIFGPAYTRVLSFLNNKMVASILTNPDSTINFRQLMDSRKIVVITLPDVDSDYAIGILGSMFFSRIRIDAMSRRDIPEEERVPCAVVIDEFGDFCDLEPKALAKFFSGIRKFNVALIVANQLLSQLAKLVKEVLGNTGTKVVFSISDDDAKEMAGVLKRGLTPADLTELPMGSCYIKPMVNESKRPTALIHTYDFPPTTVRSYPAARLEDGWRWVERQGLRRGTREADQKMADWISRHKGCLPKYDRILMMSTLRYAPPAVNRFATDAEFNSVVQEAEVDEYEQEQREVAAAGKIKRGFQ